MHLLTCIGFCSLNLTCYRQRRKVLSGMFIVLITTSFCSFRVLLLECSPVISRQSSCYMLFFYAMLCSVNLTFYRQWRKFLRRDVYRAYHFLRQFSLGMFASYIAAVWGIHWLPNHTWLVDGSFSPVIGKPSLTCRWFFFSFSAGVLVASPSFLSSSPVPVLCCWLFGGGYSPHLECSAVAIFIWCPVICMSVLLLFLMFNVPINRTLFSVDAN